MWICDTYFSPTAFKYKEDVETEDTELASAAIRVSKDYKWSTRRRRPTLYKMDRALHQASNTELCLGRQKKRRGTHIVIINIELHNHSSNNDEHAASDQIIRRYKAMFCVIAAFMIWNRTYGTCRLNERHSQIR